MKKLLCASIFVLAFCAGVFAQNNKPASCPKIIVDYPAAKVPRPGETITLMASVEGIDEKNLIYIWAIDAGEITSGQGTSVISVKAPNSCLTATVEVKGFPDGCPYGDSETICGDPSPQATKIDEFGKATNGNVKMRFDNFMRELQNDPNAQGYVINYGSAKEIAKRQRQIRNAIAFRKFDASRITLVRGGQTDETIKTQFWVVPAGATPPTPGKS